MITDTHLASTSKRKGTFRVLLMCGIISKIKWIKLEEINLSIATIIKLLSKQLNKDPYI